MCISSDWDFLSLVLSLNLNTMFFAAILILILRSVLIFSTFYLKREEFFFYFLFMLSIFILSMLCLCIRYRIFSLIIFWDLLGIRRFFLVLFYNNWDSCRGSINTVLTNRLGDFFLFIFLLTAFFNNQSFGRFLMILSSIFF